MVDKLLSGIKSMYVNNLAFFKVKGGDSEQVRIDCGVRQGCIMSPWLFYVYMDVLMKKGGEGDYLASCIHMTCFCMVSQRRT